MLRTLLKGIELLDLDMVHVINILYSNLENGQWHSANEHRELQFSVSHSMLIGQVAWAFKLRENVRLKKRDAHWYSLYRNTND